MNWILKPYLIHIVKLNYMNFLLLILLFSSCLSESNNASKKHISSFIDSVAYSIKKIEHNKNTDELQNLRRAINIKIGNNLWMTENLNVDTYLNGDIIPQVDDPVVWSKLSTGAWCYYENDASNGKIYGKLYNWYAVNDPRGLAPTGWYLPSDKEWMDLADVLGGNKTAGIEMKATIGWKDDGNGTNRSGFEALPSGYRKYDGEFNYIGYFGGWWSSTVYSSFSSWSRNLYSSQTELVRDYGNKNSGLSIRCIKYINENDGNFNRTKKLEQNSHSLELEDNDKYCSSITDGSGNSFGIKMKLFYPCTLKIGENNNAAFRAANIIDETFQISVGLYVSNISIQELEYIKASMNSLVGIEEFSTNFTKSIGGGNVTNLRKVKISGTEGIELILTKKEDMKSKVFKNISLITFLFHADKLINLSYSTYGLESKKNIDIEFNRNIKIFKELNQRLVIY